MSSQHKTTTVTFSELGPASVLQLQQEVLQEPDVGEVRLRVEAIGLNRAEVMFRQGQYLEQPELSSRLGYEAAGVIDALGDGVDGIRIGDRVSTIPAFSMGEYGVYGESAIVPAHAVARYPEHLTSQQGASIWMQYITAYGALIELGAMQKGDHILITAASSSVGIASIQIANAIGAIPIAVTRSDDKRQMLIDAGAKHVIVTNEMDLAQSVMQITENRGARIIFDPIGGPIVNQLADAASQNAIIVEYGALSSEGTPFPLFPSLAKSLTIRGYVLFEVTQDPERLERARKFIYTHLENGNLVPILDKRQFQLNEIVQAHEYMESNVQLGKIVVNV